MEGVLVMAAEPGGRPPVGSRGKAPVGGLRDEVSLKLKQNVKLACNF